MRARKTWMGWMTALAGVAILSFALTAAAKGKGFMGSDDAKEKDEPQEFLKNYDSLVEGKDADWVYFPTGSLKSYKNVSVKDFEHNGKGRESRDAAEDGREYMENWLEEEKFTVVKSGGDLVITGNVFNAWEPSGAARVWGGWMANPGVGLEIMAKDSSGKVVGEVRHKSKGSTVRDAVENGLEEMAKALSAGK